MKLTLSCPNASYGKDLRIRCSNAGDGPCGHQYFKSCKGWWALVPRADRCLLRKKEEPMHEEKV